MSSYVEEDCTCLECGLNYAFDLPRELIDAARHHKLVIFAGAGVSTETRRVFPRTIYENATMDLGLDTSDGASFPDVMQAFQDKFGRTELVRMIVDKLMLVDSFVTARNSATEFHRELATMPYLRDIVTTNWDQYFEDICGATPYVTGADVALWETAGRRVLKVHGSIANLGSLVITESDYAKRLDGFSTDAMGAFLRNFLATRTVVYVGYSLTDWNVKRLHSAPMDDLQGFAPRSYVVSPFAEGEVNELGMHQLKTSGTQFLRQLKSALIGHCNIGDEAFEAVRQFEAEIQNATELALSAPHKRYPAVVYSWAYCDGARDMCNRVLYRQHTGEFSDRHHVEHLFRQYTKAQDAAEAAHNYSTYAYLDACVNVLLLLLDDDWGHEQMCKDEPTAERMLDGTPRYFVYGATSPMLTEADFREALAQSTRRSPKVRRAARADLGDLPDDMTLRMDPFKVLLPVERSDQ